jgi:hypothetical protein
MKKAVIVMVLFLLCAWVPVAHSGGGILTPVLVERFIRDFPGYVELLKKYEGINASTPAGYVNAHVTAREVLAYIRKKGWTPEEFSATTGAVMQAFSALMMKEAYAANAGQMAEGMKQMEEALKDPSIPAETKAAIRANMENMANAQQAGTTDVPPGNLAAVAPYRQRLQEMLQSLD